MTIKDTREQEKLIAEAMESVYIWDLDSDELETWIDASYGMTEDELQECLANDLGVHIVEVVDLTSAILTLAYSA